jgi:hypothetical protein
LHLEGAKIKGQAKILKNTKNCKVLKDIKYVYIQCYFSKQMTYSKRAGKTTTLEQIYILQE